MKVDPFRQNSWSEHANTLNGYQDPKTDCDIPMPDIFFCPNKLCTVVRLVRGSLFIFYVRLSSVLPCLPRLYLIVCGVEHFLSHLRELFDR